MSIAIISSQSSLNSADLVAAARNLHIACTVYSLKDLVIDVDTMRSSNFFAHDIYIFRGYNKSYYQAQALAQLLVRCGKTVIDRQLTSGFIPSKLHEALTYKHQDVPHIRTYQARDFHALQTAGVQVVYPVVVKDIDSQRGRGVRLCQDEQELRSEIEAHGDTIIVQDFVEMDYDIRVLCVGDTVLGAIKRESLAGDFRANISLGGRASKYDLNEHEKALALQAHHSMRYDVSGVDLAYDKNGRLFVIETNITPEWQGFKAATGCDVGAAIVAYAIERHTHDKKD